MARDKNAKNGRKRNPLQVNTPWLLKRMEELGLSQRALSRKVSIDVSGLNHLLHGRRLLQLAEAPRLASALDVSTGEVLEVFGVRNAALGVDGSNQKGAVPVSGWIDGELSIHTDGVRGKRIAIYPFSDRDVRCLRYQTTGTELAYLDGSLLFYKAPPPKGAGSRGVSTIDSAILGRQAIVRIAGSQVEKLRIVQHGYGKRDFNLTNLNGKILEEGVMLDYAYPILMTKS